MNYQKPELRQLLAGEYVLGTLHGRARQRFERLLDHNRLLQREVVAWERKLDGFNHIKPVSPPAQIWKTIQAKVAHMETNPRAVKARISLWQKLTGLTSLAAILVLAVALNFYQTNNQSSSFEASFIAVVNNADAQPLWLIKADTNKALLEIEAINVPSIASNEDYELWLLPENAQAPISLGLLPQSGSQRLSLEQAQQLASAAGIAVSLEPKGGSPTGAPTGPVLYQGQFSTRS